MKTIHLLYNQMAEMIALVEPEKLKKLKASNEMQTRFNLLMEKHKQNDISVEEKDELDHFIVLERLIRLAKVKAIHPPKA